MNKSCPDSAECLVRQVHRVAGVEEVTYVSGKIREAFMEELAVYGLAGYHLSNPLCYSVFCCVLRGAAQ